MLKSNTRLLPVLLAGVVLVPPVLTAAEPTVRQWVQSNAIPLTTVQAGHGFADMQPLKKIVGDARIVSLGEATHGTSEFFRLKHRMLEFLATEMGFTIFSMEAGMPEASRLNDYVLNGTGDPAELLKGLNMWPWDTREVLDMITWMRAFNKSGKGRIEFTGFDMQAPELAGQIVRDFAGKYDPCYLPVIRNTPYVPPSSARSSSYHGSFPVKDAAGKTLRLSANIKTQDVTGYAGLYFFRDDGEVDGKPRGILKNLGAGAPRGTTGWKRYAVEIAVPADTRSITVGVILDGAGTAWFDGIEMGIDGKLYTRAEGFAILDQGRVRPNGTFSIGPGYEATFESKESSGAPAPALEIGRIAHSDTVLGQWRQILEHMESSRNAYLAKGASARDADWAIQNVRIVIQSAQMRGALAQHVGSVRDRAMADNVKWILDHSPAGTRIVLWAHNTHVTTEPFPTFKTMGTNLRSMYGSQMVAFGFAFNKGSFQARERNKPLRIFTLGTPRAGTIDAVLASSGIPIFALDLRNPIGAAAIAWVKQSHETRSVDLFYSDDQAESIYYDRTPREAGDTILFVDSTSAAVPNPPLHQ
jgi:erythromycin esterase-like protein